MEKVTELENSVVDNNQVNQNKLNPELLENERKKLQTSRFGS